MKTAIILHGMTVSKERYFDPDTEVKSNKNWLPWIQKQLLINNILAQAIELPKPYEPVYEDWKKVFEQFNIDEETILIGHSCGAGFLIRWLSENDIKVGKVALVAPYLGLNGMVKSDFFNFEIDPNVPERTKGLFVFYSDNDKDHTLGSVDILKKNFKGAKFIELKGRGHFILKHMGTREFPELRDVLLK